MTVIEFKERYPQYSHLEGNELWNKMEDVFILEHSAIPFSGEYIEFEYNGIQFKIDKNIDEFFSEKKNTTMMESYRYVLIDLSQTKKE